MNSKKNSKVGQRQRDLAEKLYRGGLLGNGGLKSVLAHR
jgi:hypothetical protein